MFFVLPIFSVILIYFLAAVLPAVFLMRYIYHHDTIEKEPPMLLLSLILMGIFAALASIVLETVGQYILGSFMEDTGTTYTIVFAFLVVAAVEEGTKFFFLHRRSWHDYNFNFRFDGIVYAVFVSLGFAAFENVRYVLGYGLTVAVPRAVLAIPGHMGFAVFMGLFYGRAKQCEARGDRGGMHRNLWAGYLSAVFLHGFYDSCAMIGNTLSTTLFLIFVAVMYVVVIGMVKRESRTDRPV